MVTVGILSRCSVENYRWLLQFLYTFLPRHNVCTVTITNDSTLSISGISFAILYHSKTRGRINITDVTDSLYDRELEEISRALGAKNVIVVIDDLEDNSDKVKEGILQNQPSIRNMAQDLFLFNHQVREENRIESTNTTNKSKIRKMITEQSAGSLISWCEQCCTCCASNTRTTEGLSRRKCILIISITAAVLLLYSCAVYWYNCRVLLC